jgi:hypothetical protein
MEFNASFVQTYKNLILHKICMNLWNLISLWCTLGTHKQISKKQCDFSNKNENLAIFENVNMNNFEHM